MDNLRANLERLDIRALATELRVATILRETKEVLASVTTSLDKLELGWAAEDLDFAQGLLVRACQRIELVFRRQPKPLTPAEQAAECEGRA